jgi:hypothetical protein
MTSRDLVPATAGFAAVAIAWTYPLVLYLGDALPALGDELLNAWVLRWNADRLRAGLAGWWDAPMFFPYGRALAYTEHQLGTAIFVAPVQWLTGNPWAAYNVALIGSYGLAGFGMYLLARELTGRRDAAMLAGLAFALAPYRGSQLAHLQVLMSGWMPVALWALTRYLRTGTPWALGVLAAAFALQALSNNYFLFFQILPLTLVAIDGLRKTAGDWRRVAGLAVAGLVALLPLMPIVYVYRHVQLEQGFTHRLAVVEGYSADVGAYLTAIPSNLFWSWLPGFRKPEGALFPGLTVLALTIVALWPRRHFSRSLASLWRVGVPIAGVGFLLAAILTGYGRMPVLVTVIVLLVRAVFPWPRTTPGLYAVIAMFAVVLSLGPEPTSWGRPLMPYGPYLALYHTVPGFGGMRVPARLATVVSLALAVVAAFGARRVLAGRPRRVRWSLAALLALGLAADGFSGPMPIAPLLGPDSKDVPRLDAWLGARPPGGVLLVPFEAVSVPQHLKEHQSYTMDVARPLVNGHRGHMPSMHRVLEHERLLSDPARAGRAMRALHAVGVRYVVFRRREFNGPKEVADVLSAIEAAVPIVERATFGSIHVVRFTAAAAPVVPELPRSAPIPGHLLRVSASRATDLAVRAIDGDPSTRWLSERPQRGRERFVVDLDRPRDIAVIRIQNVPRGEANYPRRLRIESVAADGTSRVIFDDEVIERLLVGLVREPRSGPIDIALPPNRSARLVLRQTGRARSSFWAINEVVLWERAQ